MQAIDHASVIVRPGPRSSRPSVVGPWIAPVGPAVFLDIASLEFDTAIGPFACTTPLFLCGRRTQGLPQQPYRALEEASPASSDDCRQRAMAWPILRSRSPTPDRARPRQ